MYDIRPGNGAGLSYNPRAHTGLQLSHFSSTAIEKMIIILTDQTPGNEILHPVCCRVGELQQASTVSVTSSDNIIPARLITYKAVIIIIIIIITELLWRLLQSSSANSALQYESTCITGVTRSRM